MINELYKAIAAGLRSVKSCTVYREDVPENFVTPSFMVTLYDQNPSCGINGRLKNSVRVDVLYFPENEVDYQEECWTVGESLRREFQPAGFKIKNRNMKITDKVLHFLFDVDYTECREESDVKMQSMSQKTEIKEE